jgi:hypothetical protein
VPIIPESNLAVQRHLQILPQIFRIDLPWRFDRCRRCFKTNADVNKWNWMGHSAITRVAAGVPVLHYYSMGKSENIRQIASQLFRVSPAVRYIFLTVKNGSKGCRSIWAIKWWTKRINMYRKQEVWFTSIWS